MSSKKSNAHNSGFQSLFTEKPFVKIYKEEIPSDTHEEGKTVTKVK